MLLYHGTTIEGLTEIRAISKDHSQPQRQVVYLTDNRAYSLFYIRDRGIDYVTCGVNADGKVFYEEWFPDQLRVMYGDVSGYLYHIREEKAVRGHHNGIFVCPNGVKAESVEYIENVYHEIQEQIAAGDVILRRFEEHSHKEIQEYYQHFAEYLHERKGKMSEKALAFYRRHFPGCIE